MPLKLVQFDIETGHILMDEATGKAQLIGYPCEACEGTTEGTPDKIGITVSGIIPCYGFNECCLATGGGLHQRGIIVDSGIGWDFYAELEQCSSLFATQSPWCPLTQVFGKLSPYWCDCSWSWLSDIDNYGHIDYYSDAECGGIYLGRANIRRIGIQLWRGFPIWPTGLQIYIAFEVYPDFLGGGEDKYLCLWPYYWSGEMIETGYEGDECLPYDCILTNQLICMISDICIASGQIVLSKV